MLHAFKLAFTAIEQVYGDEAGYGFTPEYVFADPRLICYTTALTPLRTPFRRLVHRHDAYQLVNEAGLALYRSWDPLAIIAKFCRDFMCTALALEKDTLARNILDIIKGTDAEIRLLKVVRKPAKGSCFGTGRTPFSMLIAFHRRLAS